MTVIHPAHQDPIKYLATQWDRLMDTAHASKKKSILCFGEIAALYSRGRAYHSLNHLVEMFRQAETLSFNEPTSVGLAIFYHDAVYGETSRMLLNIPATASNEEQSAQLAEQHLPLLGFDAPTIARVASLIRMTEKHDTNASDHDAALFIDVDMSILGAPPHIYERYAGQVRQEYMQYDDKSFCFGRLQFLTTTLDAGKRLFLTNLYQEHYGPQAEQNMIAEKRHLETIGTPYGFATRSPLPRHAI